jgi:hypothetical protein
MSFGSFTSIALTFSRSQFLKASTIGWASSDIAEVKIGEPVADRIESCEAKETQRRADRISTQAIIFFPGHLVRSPAIMIFNF